MPDNNKKYLANFMLVIISILFSLGICEAVVRIFNLAPEIVYIEKWRVRLSDNPVIGYEPIPKLNSTGKSVQFFGYDGRSNNMGYRDYDHPTKKPDGLTRVAVFGDSVTAGLWINDDNQVYTTIMEQQLKAKHSDISVMNFGVSGYNTRQEVETLKVRGMQFSPDIVVFAYCLNDRWQDDGNIYGALLAEEQSATAGNNINRARTNILVRNSALLRMITYKVFPASPSVNPQDTGKAVDAFYEDTIEQAFAELAALSKSHGFEVLLVVFPDFGKNDEGLTGNYQYSEEHQKLLQIAQSHNFDFLDLLEPFKNCKSNAPSGYTISYDRYHPNPFGHRCAGEAIANYISTNMEVD